MTTAGFFCAGWCDGAEILVRRPEQEGQDPVSAMAWDETGSRLLFGTTEGKAGLLKMPA